MIAAPFSLSEIQGQNTAHRNSVLQAGSILMLRSFYINFAVVYIVVVPVYRTALLHERKCEPCFVPKIVFPVKKFALCEIQLVSLLVMPRKGALDRESTASHRYPEKSKDIQMDIHKSMDSRKLISRKHGYPLMDIYCLRISIAEYPCMDIPTWISMWIPTLV